MTTRKFVSFLGSIIIVIIFIPQHKFLAAYSTDVGFQTSTWKTTFTCILKRATEKKIRFIQKD